MCTCSGNFRSFFFLFLWFERQWGNNGHELLLRSEVRFYDFGKKKKTLIFRAYILFIQPSCLDDLMWKVIWATKCCEPVLVKMHPTDFLRLILAAFAPCMLVSGRVGALACQNECETWVQYAAIYPASNAAEIWPVELLIWYVW